METGRDELVKALRKEGLPLQKLMGSDQLKRVSEAMHYADLDGLYAAIGEGHVSGQAVAQRLARELRGGDQDVQLPSTVRQPRRATSRQGIGLHVEGLDDVMVRLARCCTPVPGDEIIGFVTRGRGVSVHRSDCANAAALAAGEVGRLIEVEWDRDKPGSFLAALEIKALDRTRLGRRRVEGPLRPPPQHPAQREPHRGRPGEQDALRVRAGRPGPSRVGPRRAQAGRQRVRRLPGLTGVGQQWPGLGLSGTGLGRPGPGGGDEVTVGMGAAGARRSGK